MAAFLTYNATLVARVDLTDALSIFQIQPDRLPRRRPWFAAGQYCVIGLNNIETPALGSVRRPMSIASAPEAAGPLEFYIRRVASPSSANPLTRLLWTRKAGDRMYLRTVAAGRFTIADTVGAADSRIRVLVAAGTGVAPFISMIRSEIYRNPSADLSKWVLLHGASHSSDLGYRDALLTLSAANHLKYWGTVSRPAEEPGWTGDVGRVESYFEPARLTALEQRLGLAPGGFTAVNVAIYICGLNGTIAGTIVALLDRGFIPADERIRHALGVSPEARAGVFYEDYDARPVIDVGDPTVVEPLRARLQSSLTNL